MNICQKCKKSPARIHVTEVPEAPEEPVQHHFCENCAVQYDLPFAPVAGKLTDNIWKLLHLSKQASRRRKVQECPQCGLTLDELRRKGRMGCAHCYEAFSRYVTELIERMHGAREHVGQRPARLAAAGNGDGRREELEGLQAELDQAIAEEAYERAADLRDRLRRLQEAMASEREKA